MMIEICHDQTDAAGSFNNTTEDCEEENASTGSDSTNEAFLEMLGLQAFEGISDVDVNADEIGNDCNQIEHMVPGLVKTPIHSDCEKEASADHRQPRINFFEVPPRCSRYLHKPSSVASFVIDNFLDDTECQSLIHLATKLSSTGFHYVTEAAHKGSDGITHMVKLQTPNKHKLSVFEHAPTLDRLWDKLEPILLPHIGPFMQYTNCSPPMGLNPRLRVLRYDASDNDVFEPHFDATTRVTTENNNNKCDMTSLLTVLIYLNDGGGKDFDGGETFYKDSVCPKNNETATKVVPSTGKVAIFEHDLYHTSVPLTFGTKYVLRTDVLFEINSNDAGVDKPRDGKMKSEITASTLMEVCQQLSLSQDVKAALDDMGLLDLTLDALFAPGISAVRCMFRDILDDKATDCLLKGALENFDRGK